MLNRIIIFQEWDSGYDLRDATIIPMFPNIARKLELKKAAYEIIESYTPPEQLSPDVEKWYEGITQWIERLGDAAAERIRSPRSDVKEAVCLHISTLKYILDELYLETQLVSNFLKSISEPTIIEFVRSRTQTSSEDNPTLFFRAEDTNWIYDILKIMVGKYPHIELREVQIADPEETIRKRELTGRGKSWLRNNLKPVYAFLRTAQRYIKFKKWNSEIAKGAPRTLVFHSGSKHIDPMLKKLESEGADFYYVRDGEIYRHADWLEKSLLNLSRRSGIQQAIDSECRSFAEELGEQNLVAEEVHRMCGAPVAPVIVRYLNYFFSKTLPMVLNSAEIWIDYLKRSKFDYSLATNSTEPFIRSYLLASEAVGSDTAKICVQHGISGYKDPLWMDTDMRPFDVYIASSHETAEHYRPKVTKDPGVSCRIYESAHYLESMKDSARENAAGSGRKILYVPCKVYSYLMGITVPGYFPGWYYRYQKALVDYFVSRSDFDFIFKEAISIRSMSYQSIIPYISDKKAPNLTIGEGRIPDYFPEVDAIIVDRPLTALYEVAASGIPFICLTAEHHRHTLSDFSLRQFERQYAFFRDADEAVTRIDAFLNDPSRENYRCSMKLNNTWAEIFDFTEAEGENALNKEVLA